MLSILCVSKLKPRAVPFIREMRDLAEMLGGEFVLAVDGVDVQSKGYIESVLDEAIKLTDGDYILRLDDDEKCSPAMVRWLQQSAYLAHDHWTFPRVHFWQNATTMLMESGYFPDHQTRLSVRAKAGGRPVIHQGSPFGGGTVAPVCLEHWTYLVKTREEQREIAKSYENLKPGTSRLPDDEFPGPQRNVLVQGYGDGSMPLIPTWGPERR